MSPEIPTQDPQATATAAPELTSEELLRLISKPLDDVLEKNVQDEVTFEKQWQLLRLDKCDKYVRGLQFLSLDDSNGYIGWNSVAGQTGSDDEDGTYDYNIDIVDSYRKKYIATLGLRPFWNAAAVPDDPQSEVDRKGARQANLCAVWQRNKWNVRVRNIELFDKQFVGGTVYVHNPFIADKQLFGEVEEPQYHKKVVMQDAPPDPITGLPQPPVPMETVELGEPKKFPATGPAFYLYDGTMVTVPFSCRDFKKVPWLLLAKEENRGILLQKYGKVLRDRTNSSGELIKEGDTTSQEDGKRTRAAAISLTGTYRPGSESLWTEEQYWLATYMFEFFPDQTVRELVYEKFPKGLKVSKVEGVTVKLENSDLNGEWGCIPPFPGSTIYQDPVCWAILGNQDIVNFLANIGVAREERGLPTAICDAELVDTEEMGKRRYLPNELVPAKASFGGSLREAIVPLPTPNKDDGAGAYLHNMVVGNTESHLGLLKPTWGGQSEQKTAAGQRMELAQGLMQLGVPGEMASQGYADAYMRGCLLIAEHAPKGFAIAEDAHGTTSEMLDIEALRAGKYHFEADPGMPMTRAEMVEVINGIIKENPDLAMAMGFLAPLAATALRDLIVPGMPEIPSPLGDVRDKVVERIQVLLQQQPVPGESDPMTGQPGPLQPSIMPEEYVDDPGQHAELTREWLNTGAGRKINPYLGGDPANMAGYQNVVAYGLFCTQKAMPPPPPPSPPKPLSVTVKAPELLIPGVPEVLNEAFGLGLPPAPEPPPMQQMGPGGPNGGPSNGAPPNGPQGPQQPMAPPAPPATGSMPAPATGAMRVQ